jgi:hypothetical protein
VDDLEDIIGVLFDSKSLRKKIPKHDLNLVRFPIEIEKPWITAAASIPPLPRPQI